jgi:hypothetical protein
MRPPLSMRLLSFLDLVETALRADGLDLLSSQVSRQVNYEAGLARMDLPGDVSLLVQNYNLPDGQLCLKVWWRDPVKGEWPSQSFFDANGHHWKSVARQVAAMKPEMAELEDVESASAMRSAG